MVACPALGNDVHFTAQGFDHLINESNSTYYRSRPRLASEQYLKLKCLDHAAAVIGGCASVSKVRPIIKKIKGRDRTGFQYELVHEIAPDKKMRVIVEKIGNGKHKFVSIMWHDHRSKPKKRPKGRS